MLSQEYSASGTLVETNKLIDMTNKLINDKLNDLMHTLDSMLDDIHLNTIFIGVVILLQVAILVFK